MTKPSRKERKILQQIRLEKEIFEAMHSIPFEIELINFINGNKNALDETYKKVLFKLRDKGLANPSDQFFYRKAIKEAAPIFMAHIKEIIKEVGKNKS